MAPFENLSDLQNKWIIGIKKEVFVVQGLLDDNGHQQYLYLDLYSTRDFYILLSMQQPKYHVGNFPLDNSCEMINGAIILFLRPS